MNIPTGQASLITRGFIVGVAAAWAILLLFHPLGEPGDFYPTIDGHVTAWLTVHIGMAIFIPLFAGAVYLLLEGTSGRAAAAGRIGLVVFAIFYAAYEVLLGVGTGILTEEVNALPEARQATGVEVLESYADSGIIMVLAAAGSVGLGVAMIGTAVALRATYGLGWVAVVLLVVSVPLIAIHEPPFGPGGLAIFIVAVFLLWRRQASEEGAAVRPVDAAVSARPA